MEIDANISVTLGDFKLVHFGSGRQPDLGHKFTSTTRAVVYGKKKLQHRNGRVIVPRQICRIPIVGAHLI
jgi:hypothetical protein